MRGKPRFLEGRKRRKLSREVPSSDNMRASDVRNALGYEGRTLTLLGTEVFPTAGISPPPPAVEAIDIDMVILTQLNTTELPHFFGTKE